MKYGDFDITLRLDWADLDKNGDPTLDVDILKRGVEFKVGRKQWHHNHKSSLKGEYLYSWKPQEQELKYLSVELTFKLQTTNIRTINGVARIIAPSLTIKPTSV